MPPAKLNRKPALATDNESLGDRIAEVSSAEKSRIVVPTLDCGSVVSTLHKAAGSRFYLGSDLRHRSTRGLVESYGLSYKHQAWLITNHAPKDIISGYKSILGDIIAVDSGLKTINAQGLLPKVIIGDFDSLDPDLLLEYPQVPVIRHQPRKNETDTELALNWCIRQNVYEGIVICNDMQGRADHYLAIIQNLLALFRQGISACIESEFQRIFFLNGKTLLEGKKGDLISLISYSRAASYIDSEGLEYPLTGLSLMQHQSRGISNVFSSEKVTIDLAEGEVLAIYSPGYI